jgi:hypothetical protein
MNPKEMSLSDLISQHAENYYAMGKSHGYMEAGKELIEKSGAMFTHGKDEEARSMRLLGRQIMEAQRVMEEKRQKEVHVSGIADEIVKRLEKIDESLSTQPRT